MGWAERARRKFQRSIEKKPGILLALPSLEGFSRTEQVLRALVAGALSARPDFPYIVDPMVLTSRYPVSDARNDCTQHFMENTDHEYLMFWDDDQIPPDNWGDLIGKGDIVSGTTFMWSASRPPIKRLQVNQFKINDQNISETLSPRLEGDPYEVDVVGTACMVIHRRVFERLGPRPFSEPVGPDGRRSMGEDMAFCRAARAAGFRITVVPTVHFDHVKSVGLFDMLQWGMAMCTLATQQGYQKGFDDATAGSPQAFGAKTGAA